MENFPMSEVRLIISNSTKNKYHIPFLNPIEQNRKIISLRINLIKTIKLYIKKYCQFASNKNNILYLSILYLDIIISKNIISLEYDKNLKYLCLCCFLLSLKFIGNYDISNKIIKNFCHNYKEEYKIFEMQCLILLEHNLIYSTAYDYLTMILANESKKLLSISSSLLYQICEDILFLCYSPFYISVVVIQLAKNSINDKSHNHYDKYFHDKRVKYLYKKFSYLINFPFIKLSIRIDNKNDNSKNNNSNINKNLNTSLKYNNLKYNNYKNTLNNNSSNVNLITNNNIQNNIVIINEYSKKKGYEHKNNKNEKGLSVVRRTYYINKIKTPINLYANRNSNKEFNHDKYNNKISIGNIDIKEYSYNNGCDDKNFKNKTNTIEKKGSLLKSYFNNGIITDNYNRNTYRIPRIRKNRYLQSSYKITNSYNSSNNLPNLFSNKNIIEKIYERIKSNSKFDKDSREGNLSTDITVPNQFKSSSRIRKKVIFLNKSSLNFKLLSGVSKEKLEKLSRNISKNLIKNSEENTKIIKFDNN